MRLIFFPAIIFLEIAKKIIVTKNLSIFHKYEKEYVLDPTIKIICSLVYVYIFVEFVSISVIFVLIL